MRGIAHPLTVHIPIHPDVLIVLTLLRASLLVKLRHAQ